MKNGFIDNSYDSASSHTAINQIVSVQDLLNAYKLTYSPSEYYWQVGIPDKVQGWILHLSVIKPQLTKLLKLILPQLIADDISFKVVKDSYIAEAILQGSLGYNNVGKIISIYPKEDNLALVLAQKLIASTAAFKGPHIPTDTRLGSIVYTRYGSFSPILLMDQDGQEVKCIYDTQGNLMPDPYNIPFVLPTDRSWPFSDITSPVMPSKPKLLNFKYYETNTIKADAKGDVFKAIYFKNFLRIKMCIIKQGRRDMFADDNGRDIRDRLKWQYDLYRNLGEAIPLPEVYDYFYESEDAYLAMKYVNGQPLDKWISSKIKERNWADLPSSDRLQILDKYINILQIIDNIHARGYIHRDITPANFILDSKGNIYIIDMELAWCINSEQPNPPFQLGTPGYMSPEQYNFKKPTVKDDIFSLGALMILLITNINPIKFANISAKAIKHNLFFLTQDQIISEVIANCFQIDPNRRPLLEDLHGACTSLQNRIKNQFAEKETARNNAKWESKIAEHFVQSALNGLAADQLLSAENWWVSRIIRKETRIGNEQYNATPFAGWAVGMSGPLWLIAEAKGIGLDTTKCKNAFVSSWNYIQHYYQTNATQIRSGLYSGSSGVAVAMIEGLRHKMLVIDNEAINFLESCLRKQTTSLDLSEGASGQGLAILKYQSLDGGARIIYRLLEIRDLVIRGQQKDGSWKLAAKPIKRRGANLCLDDGIAGIILFLLMYLKRYPDDVQVKQASKKALQWMINQAIGKDKNTYIWSINLKATIRDKWSTCKGNPGIALVFILAYETLQDPLFMNIAEGILKNLPDHPVKNDYSFATGLAGIGEIYLDAHRVFGSQLWQDRALWISRLFLHTYQRPDRNAILWITDATSIPSADLFAGNSGVIHFLMRVYSNNQMNHPLL